MHTHLFMNMITLYCHLSDHSSVVFSPKFVGASYTMATAVVDAHASGSESCRATRTGALPKRSLFGSMLEIQDENMVKGFQVDSVPVTKEHTVKGPGLRFQLPDDVKKTLPGIDIAKLIKMGQLKLN